MKRNMDITRHHLFGAFIARLIDYECFDSADVRRVIEKPWNWRAEFVAFVCRVRDGKSRDSAKVST